MSDNNWEVAGKGKSGKKPFGVHTNKVCEYTLKMSFSLL